MLQPEPVPPHGNRQRLGWLGGLLFLALAAPVNSGLSAHHHGGLHCEFIRRLALDFLNDGVSVPEAQTHYDGTIRRDRLAAFQVYAQTSFPGPHVNITEDRRSLRVRVHRLPGNPAPLSRIHYVVAPSGPQFLYKPRPLEDRDQTVLLSFELRCLFNDLSRRYFLLDVLGADAPPPDGTGSSAETLRRSPACDALTRLGVDFLADDREGDDARDTRSGELPPHKLAAFALHGLAEDPTGDRDLTAFESRIGTRVWTAPGSPSAAGRFRFVRREGRRQLLFQPDRLSQKERNVVLTFTYRCTGHSHRRDFLLVIPARAGFG